MQSGDRSAATQAERLLSTAWVQYVQALERPAAGMTYADSWIKPGLHLAQQVLALAAASHALADHVQTVSNVNPFYASLRDTAWQELQGSGTAPDPRVLATLDRARVLPSTGRYVVVDAATAKLWMVEDGHVAIR